LTCVVAGLHCQQSLIVQDNTGSKREEFNMAKQTQVECCKVESVVTVDERGQMVLPKEIRERAGIRAGDKLAVVSVSDGDKLCCITLIKADALSGTLKVILKPMLGGNEKEDK
jgi:antitoxin PrlF